MVSVIILFYSDVPADVTDELPDIERRGGKRDNAGRKKQKTNQWCVTINGYLHRKYSVWRKLRGVYRELVVAREFGGENKDREHLHLYVKTDELYLLEEFKSKIGIDLGFSDEQITQRIHVEPVRSFRNYMVYISKEDYKLCHQNVDVDSFSYQWRMMNFISRNHRYCLTDPFILGLPTQYSRKFREAHTEYWRDSVTASQLMSDIVTEGQSEGALKELKNCKFIGIYLYGEPGSGKSTTALAAGGTDYFMFNETSENFSMSGYAGEKIVIFDEASETFWEKFRPIILQATGGLNFCVSHKGANQTMHPPPQRFIITTNFEPPQEGAFERRFKVIYMTKNN